MGVNNTTTINTTAQPQLSGNVILAAGTNVTITQSAQTITIASSGSGGVTSITGTANQVIASASTGAVTLSTPQDIATTSTPTFAGIVLNGTGSVNVNINSVSTNAIEDITSNSAGGTFQSLLESHTNTSATAPTLAHLKSSGTRASPTISAINDAIGFHNFYGYTGNVSVGYQQAVQVQYWICADGTTVSTTSMPGRFQLFTTPDGSVVPAERLRINCNGVFTIFGNLKVIQGTSGGQATIQPIGLINNPLYAMVIDTAITNLVTNPSFETNTTSWGNTATASISRITSDHISGDACLQVVVASGSAQGATYTVTGLTIGLTYTVSCFVKSVSLAAGAFGQIITNTSGGAFSFTTTTSWARNTANFVATATSEALIFATATAAGTFLLDAIQVELSTTGTATTYADGSMGQGYAWNGTAHASTSTRAAGLHVINPSASVTNGFAIDVNGGIQGGCASVHTSYSGKSFGNSQYAFLSTSVTLNSTTSSDANLGATLKVVNSANGTALVASSAVTTDIGAIVSTQSITSGTAFSIAINADKSNFTGEYFKFTSKSATDQGDWRWSKVRMQIGTATENLNKSINWYGGGNYSKSNTQSVPIARTGTISQSGTTVTGTTTNFSTFFIVGDIFVPATGAATVITAIASATSMTVQTSQTIAGGTDYSRAATQYSPAILFQEQAASDHRTAQVPALIYAKFYDSVGHPRIQVPAVLSGTSTLTTTSASTAFTTAANDAQIAVGDWVYCGTTANNMSPRQVLAYSGTSGTFRTAADATVAAIAYRVRKSGQFTYPSGDTDVSALYYNYVVYKDTAGKTLTNNTSEQSWFNTTQVIPGGAFASARTLKFRAWGTSNAGAASTLVIKVKLGGTTIINNTAVTVGTATAQDFIFEGVIQANGTANQNNYFQYRAQTNAAAPAATTIMLTQQSTVNTNQDLTFDISSQFAVTAGQIILYGLELIWE